MVEKFGDTRVTYAVFMRRPVISAPRLAIAWLNAMAKERKTEFQIDLRYAEGRWVGAGEPMMYITGSLFHLSDLETILLQKLGPACVAAFNAFTMCSDLPKVAFLAMDARVPASPASSGTDVLSGVSHAVAVASGKGGVGKSTSATNIALGITHVLRHVGAANCRVLLIDTDSQGHATLVTTGRNDFGADDSLRADRSAGWREVGKDHVVAHDDRRDNQNGSHQHGG